MENDLKKIIQGPFVLPLTGDRLSLHPLEPADLDKMAPFFADVKSIYYYLPDTLLPRNLQQLKVMMEDWNDGKENFAFSCRFEGEAVGLVTLSALDPISGHAEIGIMIAEEKNRGKGLAKEALTLLMDYAFGDLRLHRLYVRVAPENQPSLDLFQALGFVLEGRMRETMRRGDAYLDLFFFGLLEEEYRRMRAGSQSRDS